MKFSALIVVALVVVVAAPVYAQSGCVNSPENPTAILALVGSAGGVLAGVRSHLARKRAGRK